MATTKKTTKKATPRKAVKSTSVTKPATKRSVTKKTASKNAGMRSFRLSAEERAFMDVQVTRQTIYWIILVAFIIFVQLWILQLHLEVASILDAQQQQLLNM